MSFYFPTSMTVKHRVVGWANRVWANTCTALLRPLVRSLFYVLICVSHEAETLLPTV